MSTEKCPNCEIKMIEKIKGLAHHRVKSKIKQYFVCKTCGFERRTK